MASFVEQQFPPEISYGSKGGPSFSTDVFEATSGAEQRNQNWEISRCRYDVSHGIKSPDQMDAILDFFYAMRGKAIGFRYKDWADYRLVDGLIGTGTGAQTAYQILKKYTVGAETYTRNLRKIVTNSVATPLVVKVNNVVKTLTTDYTIDYNTGIITFVVAPTSTHPINVTCDFDVPVRFDTDEMSITQEAWELQTWDSIPLVEIKPLA